MTGTVVTTRFAYDEGACTQSMEATFRVPDGNGPAYGLPTLYANAWFYNHHSGRPSTIDGIGVADDDSRISVKIHPVGAWADGEPVDYDFGADRPIPVRNRWQENTYLSGPWANVVGEDVPWREIVFRFDVVITPNPGCPALTEANCVWGTLSDTPFTVGLWPSGGVAPRNNPEPSDGGASTPVGDGAGEFSVTKVFYNIDGSQIPENFNMDYSFKRNGVPFRTGNLAKADAVPGSLDGNPTLTWTLRTYILKLDGNGGEPDTETDRLAGYGSPRLGLSAFGPDRTASRAGYEFTGWNTEADGSGEDVDLSGNVYELPAGLYKTTLYAQWKQVGGSELPKTGSDGTAAYVAAGVALIVVAGVGAAWYAARKKDDDGGDPHGREA